MSRCNGDHDWVVIAITLALFVGMLVTALIASAVDYDMKEFGTRLCESQSYEFDKITRAEDNNYVPVIHCKENTTQSVYDGVVVLNKGGNNG